MSDKQTFDMGNKVKVDVEPVDGIFNVTFKTDPPVASTEGEPLKEGTPKFPCDANAGGPCPCEQFVASKGLHTHRGGTCECGHGMFTHKEVWEVWPITGETAKKNNHTAENKGGTVTGGWTWGWGK